MNVYCIVLYLKLSNYMVIVGWSLIDFNIPDRFTKYSKIYTGYSTVWIPDILIICSCYPYNIVLIYAVSYCMNILDVSMA